MSQRWLPLESNPQSMNNWSKSLGLNTAPGGGYSFADCYGLDPELLAFVSKPVKAVLMLFPITDAYETMRKAQDADVEANGVSGVESIIFIRQTISNACGTFALLHALANAGIPLQDDSPLHKLFEDCIDKSPLERAKLIEVSGDIERVHEATAMDGQTPTPALDADVDLHFVCFVEHKGSLIELDGRRNSPINHGPIKVGLLEDTAEVVKKIIEITNSIRFNLITLSATPDEEE